MPRTGRAAAVVAALLFLSLPALPGCASASSLTEADLLGQRQVVNELRPGAAREAAAVEGNSADAAAAGDRAEALLEAGDAAGALEEVRRALLVLPPAEQSDRLRELRLRAKRAFLRSSVARATTAAPERETEGWPLRVKVSLRNLSPAPIEVGTPPAGASPTTARLHVVRTAYDIGGNVRIEAWEVLVPFDPGSAPPGGALTQEVTVETERFRDLVPHGFLTYDFGGEVLLSAARAGQVDLSDRIPLETSRTTTFPQRGWREVAGEPAAHLERGLREGNPVRILLASACLPEADRAPAAVAMARRLREDQSLVPGAAAGVRAALRFLAADREADGWTASRWEEWARAPAAPAEEER